MPALPGSYVLGSNEINANFNRLFLHDLVSAGSLVLATLVDPKILCSQAGRHIIINSLSIKLFRF